MRPATSTGPTVSVCTPFCVSRCVALVAHWFGGVGGVCLRCARRRSPRPRVHRERERELARRRRRGLAGVCCCCVALASCCARSGLLAIALPGEASPVVPIRRDGCLLVASRSLRRLRAPLSNAWSRSPRSTASSSATALRAGGAWRPHPALAAFVVATATLPDGVLGLQQAAVRRFSRVVGRRSGLLCRLPAFPCEPAGWPTGLSGDGG